MTEDTIDEVVNEDTQDLEPTPVTAVAESANQTASTDERLGVKELIAELRAGGTRSTPVAEEKPMSDAEKKQFFAIFDPEDSNKEFYSKWFRLNPDATPEERQEAKALFAHVQQGLMRQSVTATKLMLQHELEKFRAELAPMRDHYSTVQAKDLRSSFDKKYPALSSDPRYTRIVTKLAASYSNQNFDSFESFSKALAEGAAEVIKDFDPAFDLSAGKQTKPQSGTTPRLPRTSAGSSGGAGSGQPAERGGKFMLPMLED